MSSVPFKPSDVPTEEDTIPSSQSDEAETSSGRSELPATAVLLGVDWGSTAVRAVLL